VSVLASSNSSLSLDGTGLRNAIIVLVVVLVVMALLGRCSNDRCDDVRSTFGAASAEYRQCVGNAGTSSGSRGGSFGGWSPGGGHK
jgi:hypothetical protein